MPNGDKPLFDHHCHLPNSLEEAIAWFETYPHTVRLCSTGPDEWPLLTQIYNRYPQRIIPCFGVHPWRVDEADELSEERISPILHELESLLKQYPAAEIGEIGLDRGPKHRKSITRQKAFYQSQLRLAFREKRSASIHCVRAWEAVLHPIPLRPKPSPLNGGAPRFLIHFYNGSFETWQEIQRRGGTVSFAPALLHPQNSKMRAVFQRIPVQERRFESDLPLSDESARALKSLYAL